MVPWPGVKPGRPDLRQRSTCSTRSTRLKIPHITVASCRRNYGIIVDIKEKDKIMLTWMPELYNRSLMRMTSFTDEEMLHLIDLSAHLKARRAAGIRGDLVHRKNIALIFEKSSTRTRNSSIIAARDEGGGAEYLTRLDY